MDSLIDPKTKTFRHGAEAQQFNSWVIGGGYSKAQMKRNQIRTDVAVQKRHGSPSSPQQEGAKAEARRAELKDLAKPIPQYKPKFAEAMREERRRQAEEAFANRRGGTPPKSSEAERRARAVETYRAEHPAAADDAAQTLRSRLKTSFEGAAQANTATLFPALLQPYGRPMNFLRGRDRKKARSAGSEPIAFPSPPQSPLPGLGHQEPFGLPPAERRRAQPASGPHAFLPTGSSTTAYRHFTNYGMLARLSAANPAATAGGAAGDDFGLSGSGVRLS